MFQKWPLLGIFQKMPGIITSNFLQIVTMGRTLYGRKMELIWTLYGLYMELQEGRQRGQTKTLKQGPRMLKKCLQNTISCPQNSIFTVFKVSFLVFQWFLFYFIPETLKYWVGVQRGQSYLMGRSCLFSHGWRPFQCWCHDKNALWGRCFTSTSFAPHVFPLCCLKLNLA